MYLQGSKMKIIFNIIIMNKLILLYVIEATNYL